MIIGRMGVPRRPGAARAVSTGSEQFVMIVIDAI